MKALMLAAVLLGMVAVAKDPNGIKGDNKSNAQGSETNRQHNLAAAPAVTATTPPQPVPNREASGVDPKAARHGARPADKPWFDSQFWFNLLLVIFTGLLAALAYRQLRAMHRQADLMSGQLASMNTTGEDTHKLAIAMKDAADAAKLSADSANAALKTQRAFIITEGFDIIDDGRWLNFKCAINNVGATPAKITEAFTCWMVAKELPIKPDYDVTNRMEHPHLMIATDKPIRVEKTIESDERERVHGAFITAQTDGGDPLEWLYIFGRISYEDAFGDSHVTGWARKIPRAPTDYQRGALLVPEQSSLRLCNIGPPLTRSPAPARTPRNRTQNSADGLTPSACEPADNEIARIRRPAFDAANVVLVDAGEFGEPLLRETTIVPEVADSPPEVAEHGGVRGHEDDATEETLLCCRVTDSMLSLP
jgi:hypothetical protein